jgi:type IV pilus assembly protein PilE
MNSNSFQRGFTLIEVMIVVVIVAILAAIALPSYENYMLQARRSAAQSFVSQVAMKEEEFFSHMREHYPSQISDGNISVDPLPDSNRLGMVPPRETVGFYTYAICTDTSVSCNSLAVPASGFIVVAKRVNRQINDSVGDVVLYSTGAKCTVTGTDPKWGNRTC